MLSKNVVMVIMILFINELLLFRCLTNASPLPILSTTSSGTVLGELTTYTPNGSPLEIPELRLYAGQSVVAPCSDLKEITDQNVTGELYVINASNPITSDMIGQFENLLKQQMLTCFKVDFALTPGDQNPNHSTGPIAITPSGNTFSAMTPQNVVIDLRQ